MGARSDEKKKLIIKNAREVFSAKGYKGVTMKDIVEACGISRGGLYLYFSNVEEVFLAVLDDETSDDDDEAVEKAISNDASAADMLALFIKEQKKEILRKKNSIIMATYEYFSEYKAPKKQSPLKKQFDIAVRIVERLIETGVNNGEFNCVDALGTARNMMYVIEGIKVSGRTMGITEEMVDKELMFIIQSLDPEE